MGKSSGVRCFLNKNEKIPGVGVVGKIQKTKKTALKTSEFAKNREFNDFKLFFAEKWRKTVEFDRKTEKK